MINKLLKPLHNYRDTDLLVVVADGYEPSENYQTFLSTAEIQQLQKKRTRKAQQQFINSRAFIKQCLADLYARNVSDIEVRFNRQNNVLQAYAEDRLLANLSLSHSASQIAVAIPLIKVEHFGVDIENTSKGRNVAALAEVSMSDKELIAFNESDDALAYFYRHWTVKEALVKALSESLPTFFKVGNNELLLTNQLDSISIRECNYICSVVFPSNTQTTLVTIN